MEPAVVNPKPAVFRGVEDFRVAISQADVGMIVGLARMHGLRCNDVISGHDHDECDGESLEVVGIESEKGTALVDLVKQRPAQRQRRALVSRQRQLVKPSKRLTLAADGALEQP
jgi:hypothetical protein